MEANGGGGMRVLKVRFGVEKMGVIYGFGKRFTFSHDVSTGCKY